MNQWGFKHIFKNLKDFKSIKKIAKILLIVIASILLALGTIVAMLQSNSVQQYLLQKTATLLSDKLQTKVQIGFVDYELFNKLSLHQLYIEDQKGDTLFYIQNLRMGFKVLPLMDKEFICNELLISELNANLHIDKNKDFNLQFFIDAFKSKEKPKFDFRLRLDNVELDNAQIKYKNLTKEFKTDRFDPNNISVSDLNLKLSITEFNKETLIAKLRALSFKEQSGLVLSDFSSSIFANRQNAKIEDFSIKLPNSELIIAPITLAYDSLANLSKPNKIKFNLEIKESKIDLNDLAALSPSLKRIKGDFKLSSQIKGSLGNIHIDKLNVSYKDAIQFEGKLDMSGLPNLSETFVHAKIRNLTTDKAKLQDLLSNLKGYPIELPDQLNRLGKIRYSGDISGFFSNLVAYGRLHTNIGDVSTDMMMELMPDFKGFEYSGSLQTKQLKLGVLNGDTSKLGDISFKISSKGSVKPQGNIIGEINGVINSLRFKAYTYEDIELIGRFNKKKFTGKINLFDKNASLKFDGSLNFTDALPAGHFALSVDNVNLYNLNLSKKNPDLIFGFNAKADFVGKEIDETNTNIELDSIFFYNDDDELFLDKIHISNTISDSSHVLNINSDILQATVKGKYSFAKIGHEFKNLISKHIPSVVQASKKKFELKENNFVFHLSNFNINKLAKVLRMDVNLSNKTSISGYYNNRKEEFHFESSIPELRLKKNQLTQSTINCDCKNHEINFSAFTLLNEKMKFNIESHIANDSVLIAFDWDNPTNFSGTLNIINIFNRDDLDKLNINSTIFPSKIWLKNKAWNIEKSNISSDFKKLKLDNFGLTQKDSYVKINGTASKSEDDVLNIDLQNFQLGDVLFAANVTKPKLDANVNGKCLLRSVFKKVILDIDVVGKDFSYYDAVWGDAYLKSSWDRINKKVVAKGIVRNQTRDIGTLNGEYYRKNDSLDFYANADKLDLKFLRYYLDGAVQNVEGEGSGTLRIFGGLKSHILLSGDIAVNKGQLEIDFLKTKYHFSDTVHIRQESISFNNIKVYDEENHMAVFDGKLTHKYFKNMKYDFKIDCKNVLGLNTTKNDNEEFYGKAYGTGKVRISGVSGDVNFNINVKTEPNSNLVVPMETSAIATENTFIKFVNKEKRKKKKVKKSEVNTNDLKTRIRLNLQLEATPDAEVAMITDPVGGDMVKANGRGNLKIQYDNTDKLKLYGNFQVEKGEYIFTLQQVIRKNFSIRNGGTIRWSGDPYVAIIDLDAVYTVPSVSLLDILDESQLEGAKRTSLPVNCLLGLTGDLMKPSIKFDLELPSDPELQRRIKNIVNTEEMMNREILALLVMNRFYKPSYLQTNTTGVNTEMVSILTTTVSGQLNNWLSQISNKVNVGVNARLNNGQNFNDGGEYEVAFIYQPNNRLVINSNVGYRNDILSTNSTNFIGDLDVEYKLNKSGKLRAKAYSHSADNYYYNTSGTARTTQGVGLLYREEFNTFQELIKLYFYKKEDTTDSTKTEVK